jgi:threonine synthase
VIALQGNFDEALALVRELAANHPIALVNSVNEFRIEGQKTAAFEIARSSTTPARRALHPGRQRRQHHRLLARLQ